MVCSAEAQLLGSKAYVGIGYTRQLFNFIFHFGSAVGTAKVLQNIYTLNFIGIRHTAGAISQALAAYIAVLLMRMADFAVTVSRMTGNVMSVCMSVFVAMVVSATAFVAVFMSMFVLMVVSAATLVAMRVSVFVLMVVSTATLVAVCMSVFMLVLVVVSATACVAVCVSVFMLMVVAATAFVTVCVSVFMLVIMLMFITTAAIIAMLMRMLFMFMVIIVSATACITMTMLRHMSHSFAAVTAGAAFRMLAVILYTIDMAVDVTKSSYIAGTVTDIF